MKHLFKTFFLMFIIVEMINNNLIAFSSNTGTMPIPIIVLLLITASNIYRHKYRNSLLLIAVEFVLISYAATTDWYFAFLYSITAYDIVQVRQYYGLLAPFSAGIYFTRDTRLFEFLLVLCVCIFFAYITSKLDMKERTFMETYDRERQYRYELEQTKSKLLTSSKQVAYLAEVNERNRIAHEIHDTIGHSMAGILMQLQAAYKLFDRDGGKSKDILKKSIDGLAEGLTLLRDTVHNIKPDENLGVEYLRKIVGNFSFCPVDARFNGDFSKIPPNHMEILATNIKEALTNTSRYSKASKVEIKIDTNDMLTRLYIKDNGVGCGKIKEGLGLSGMNERIRNIGGSMSVSSDDGFLIVCIIPKDDVGGAVFESTDSR